MNESQVSVANGRFKIDVMEQGDGQPLLFLHGISGLRWTAFLDRLSEQYRVIAPRHPGFGDESQQELDSVHDLVYAYLDLLDGLGLEGVPLVGHSLGGMIAAELAATQPKRFSRLALIAPFGLYDLDRPTFDLFATTPGEAAAAMFHDPKGEAAAQAGETGLRRLAEAGSGSDEGQELVTLYVERAKTLATAAKYLWPIPNRGLKKRIHRISTPTLLVWGASDRVVPPSYAEDFQHAIPGAKCDHIEDAGHEVPIEQPDRLAEVVTKFFG
jgi:pimeloyl-ACP methyl ester carboxylesterase